jgi:7-keto-8-aminopelargonate synthetase-like enzyme
LNSQQFELGIGSNLVVHLELEKALPHFMGQEEAIIYRCVI